MKKIPVYWTLATGEKVCVDDMTGQHCRNTLKLVLQKIEEEQLRDKNGNKLDWYGINKMQKK